MHKSFEAIESLATASAKLSQGSASSLLGAKKRKLDLPRRGALLPPDCIVDSAKLAETGKLTSFSCCSNIINLRIVGPVRPMSQVLRGVSRVSEKSTCVRHIGTHTHVRILLGHV